MEGFDDIKDMLPWLIPLVMVELGLMIIALVDLVKRDKVRGDSRVVWALIIIFVSIIGPVAYLLGGRGEEEEKEEGEN